MCAAPGPGLTRAGDQILLDASACSMRISTLDSTGYVGLDTSVAGCYREARNAVGDGCLVFRDGFESGGPTACSATVP